ncbi:MAG: hypothetical protein FWG71_08065 [Synergistaceae bacterium]|nr:hypothetical protein [Synergistaceae bacterium]
MAATRHVSRVLTLRFTAIVLAASLLVASAPCFVGVSFAARKKVSKSSQAEQQRMLTTIKNDIVLIGLAIFLGVDEARVKSAHKDYQRRYDRDHKILDSSARVSPTMSGYQASPAPTTGRHVAPVLGYRNAPPRNSNYAVAYVDRIYPFRESMIGWSAGAPPSSAKYDGIDGANVAEAEKIPGQTQTWITDMNRASRDADGYIQVIQAGTQEANYLNMELAELRSDTMRQTDLHLLMATEEAQDDFDEMFSFEMAMGRWKSTGTGTSY